VSVVGRGIARRSCGEGPVSGVALSFLAPTRRPFAKNAHDDFVNNLSLVYLRTASGSAVQEQPAMQVRAPESRIPNPETRNLKPASRISNPESHIPNPESRIPNPGTGDPTPSTPKFRAITGQIYGRRQIFNSSTSLGLADYLTVRQMVGGGEEHPSGALPGMDPHKESRVGLTAQETGKPSCPHPPFAK